MYTLVEESAKVLREPTQQFDFDNPTVDPVELKTKLAETMYHGQGLGLSANQVGLNARAFVMRTQEKEDCVICINPVIRKWSKETVLMEEGCLSFPGLFVSISRPATIEVEFYNEKGEKQEAQYGGITARCFQHELDHLDGILFIEHASRLKLERAQKKREKRIKERERVLERLQVLRTA
jgi:peptide deformylase